MVLLSTAQGVARAQWRTKGYDADGDDETRTLAAFVARARAHGPASGAGGGRGAHWRWTRAQNLASLPTGWPPTIW
jgi:hypothetical protein